MANIIKTLKNIGIIAYTALALGKTAYPNKTNEILEKYLLRKEPAVSSSESRKNLENSLLNTEKQNLPYQTKDPRKDSEQILLARLLFGEARDCGYAEKLIIGYSVLNRKSDGWESNGEGSIKSVALKPSQYSCFDGPISLGGNGSKTRIDVNLPKVLNPLGVDEDNAKQEWQECLKASKEVLEGKYKWALNRDQKWYHTRRIRKPRSWKTAKRINDFYIRKTFGRKIILKHKFYKHQPKKRHRR